MGVWLRKIIQDNQGNVFVYGAFNERQAHIGKDVILADSISSSGTSFYYSGHFLIKLNDKNCTPPSINDVPHHPFNRIICPDQVFQLDAGPGFVDYEWSNGSKTQKIEVSELNRYTVKVKDKNNCISYSSPISILHKENSSVHNLCLITYENDKQIIYGTLNFDYSTKNYKIYKIDKATGDTVDVLFEDYKNYLNVQFVDENSTPSTKAYLYSISKVDTCGLESPVSVAHKPILLKIRKEGTSNLLEWEPYEGMDIHSYHIYKGTDKGKMRLVDSIGVSVLIYVDTNLDSLFHYQVKANKKLFCYLGSSNYFGTTSSNIVVDEAYVPTIVEATEMDINADLFPNPAHDILTIQLPEQKQVTIVLKNLLGEVLYKTSGNQNKFEIPMQNFKQGLYVISIDYGVERKQFKIIKH